MYRERGRSERNCPLHLHLLFTLRCSRPAPISYSLWQGEWKERISDPILAFLLSEDGRGEEKARQRKRRSATQLKATAREGGEGEKGNTGVGSVVHELLP